MFKLLESLQWSLLFLQKALSPPLPPELALSFYVQGWKVVFAVYHVIQDRGGGARFNRYQAECVVPWLNEVLLLLTVGLQTAQQLKDKVNVFTQYQDMSFPDLTKAADSPAK